MEEDEPDYKTPIGRVIKQINTLCKKPQIDEQLSEALDLFNKKLEEQEKYLVNGIFKINFTEAALFLQSSAELYGKKIDLLWDDLLEYHTRLIRYDCEHQKEKGAAVDKAAIEKLEERRNRYKRKKKFKLLLQSSEVQKVSSFLFDEEKENVKADNDYNQEDEMESSRLWKEFEFKSAEMRKTPAIVYKQMMQHYQLKNYPVLKSHDFEIWDPDDDEFNTRYSRVPGWHHTWHLFEYNDKGLLPDNHNIIAKLRLAAYKRIRFLASRKIPFSTPYEEYEEEYIAFRNKFFEEEAKKWQNMPLDSLADLRKQLQYLAQKEREENGDDMINNDNLDENVKFDGYGMAKDNNSEDTIEKIDLLDSSEEDSLFELSFTCDKEFMKSDLFVRLEKLSSDLINTKLRQDSGFFDLNSDDEDDDDDAATVDNVNPESETIPATENTEVTDGTVNTETNNSVEASKETDNGENVVDENQSADNIENTDNGADFDDTRSYISDHDYCLTVPPLIGSDAPGSKAAADVDETAKNVVDTASKAAKGTVSEPFFAVPRAMPRVVKLAQRKDKVKLNTVKIDDHSLPKRRKLSTKQVAKLLQSKIKPVKELKFEKFFSMNYQTQMGEGEVPPVDYESGDSDTESLDDGPPADDVCSEHSRQDDVQSIMSDHDYCQLQQDAEHLQNDSGFLDTTHAGTLTENAPVQSVPEDSEPSTSDVQSREQEEEYQKLLAILRASDGDDERSEQIRRRQQEEAEFLENERRESQVRVEQWRNRITPILRNLRENDFDIHAYGSRIMEDMEVNESKPFGNIVRGHPSPKVVRFFISALQLANTNNIEICGAQKGRLSNETFEVKLLTKDRYHEHLDEYLAPSEETFREKMERVRAMKADKPPTSDESPTKKPKLMPSVKGKRNKTSIKKTSAKSSSHANVDTPPSLTVHLPQDVTIDSQLRTSQANTIQNENDHSPNTYRRLSKGKSIVKRPAMSETSPNTRPDPSMPSTSRHYYMAYPTVRYDEQTPSTSSAPDVDFSRYSQDVSPNKRRRVSDEESFREHLLAAQGTNPDVQLHSTPCGPKQLKSCGTLQKSLLFN